jgi:hypothetical protein
MLVGFQYLEQGICVGRQFFPIVKMEWAEGNLLHEYTERHLRSPQALRQLADEWRRTIDSLKKSGIAHGDLQHGNIFVVRGKIRLVDYDGMYVPALRGNPPAAERGHRNFQHPKRTEQDYDENMDNFSALVIYLSLLAVAAEPRLWNDFHTGENLILSEADFKSPGQKDVWKRLKKSPDAEVRRLADALEGCYRGLVSGVPTLKTVLKGSQLTVADWLALSNALGISPQSPPPTISIPDWLRLKDFYEKERQTRLPPPPRPSVICSKGHLINKPSFYRRCPVCGEALYGYRSCPHCHKSIPDRSTICPQCREQTGWSW